ncbi:hypothetical protein [Streptomyces sp. NPDC002758]
MTDLLYAAALLVGLIGTVWCSRKTIQAWREVLASAASIIRSWRAGDYRSRCDRAHLERILRATPPTEQQQPGTDTDLYLDAALTYYGPAGLARLHNAINQHREEPQP